MLKYGKFDLIVVNEQNKNKNQIDVLFVILFLFKI